MTFGNNLSPRKIYLGSPLPPRGEPTSRHILDAQVHLVVGQRSIAVNILARGRRHIVVRPVAYCMLSIHQPVIALIESFKFPILIDIDHRTPARPMGIA